MAALTRNSILLTLVFTTFSVIVSSSVALLWFELDSDLTRQDVLMVATLIPLIVAPICTLFGLRGRRRVQQLAGENERLAHTDMLTGLPNRRAFFTQIVAPEHAEDASERSVAYIICDVDKFKTFNDQHGHEVGDQVLIHVAGIIKNALPGSATVARLGGEEFVVFCEEAVALEVDALSAHLVHSVANAPLSYLGDTYRVTMSVGASITTANGDPDRAIRDADRAMYMAKSNGRNQFVRAA